MKNRIKDIQDKLGFKQYEMAKDYNANINTFSNWENDNAEIPLKDMVGLSNKYSYSIDYLLCLSDKDIKYDKLDTLDAKVIGNNIKALRKELDITQGRLAKVCDVHEDTIGKYERGEYLITGYKLYLICLKYNVSMDEMLGRTVTNNKIEV